MPKLGEIKRGREIHYGSPSGQYIWITCSVCNSNPKWKQLVGGRVAYPRCQSCANRHFGKANAAWKGGKTRRCDGYVFVLLKPNSPLYIMANARGYVLEHRFVMAQHLQRPLKSWEVVHHKNGIRFDNKLVNLELLPKQAYHIVDTVTKSLLKQQALKLEQQAKQIRLLAWRIKQLEVILRGREIDALLPRRSEQRKLKGNYASQYL